MCTTVTDLEPINGTTVDQRREFSQAVAKSISDGRHGQHDVKLVPHTLDEQVEQRHRGSIRLLRLVSLSETTQQSLSEGSLHL